MANVITTPNMSLPNPIPNIDSGPDYADNIQSCFDILDQHNHAPGSGVQINPSGLNIISDLPFGSNNATLLRSSRYVNQGSPISGASDLCAIYASGGNLYYNNSSGTQVQITNGSSVNAGAGSITGLPSGTASVSFSSSIYVFQSATSTPATIDVGSVIIRNTTASSDGITLKAPTLATNYNIALPAIPSVLGPMTLDTSGNMGSVTYDQVGQNMTSTGANAIAASRTRSTGSTVAIGGVASSASSGTFTSANASYTNVTNLSVTITTSGRPIFVGLIAAPGSLQSQVGIQFTTTLAEGFFKILNNTTSTEFIHTMQIEAAPSGGAVASQIPCSSINTVDFQSAGTYNYLLQVASFSGDATVAVTNCILVAYEL